MFENAKIYNEQKSQIYKDANTLQQMVREFEGTVPPKLVGTANGRIPHRRSNGVTDGGPELKLEEAMMRVVTSLLNTVDESTYATHTHVKVNSDRWSVVGTLCSRTFGTLLAGKNIQSTTK